MSLLSETPNPEPISKVTVHHTFSNQFRVIHGDGVWYSMSEKPFIHLMFYTTRLPMPTEVEYKTLPHNMLGEEIPGSRKTREGFDREFQVDVVMTVDQAKAISEGLKKFLETAV